MSNRYIHFIIIATILKIVNTKIDSDKLDSKNLIKHTKVTDSSIYPYTVAVLRGNSFVSSGAILDENWILTTADGLFLMADSIRQFRIRLGSINYKKGGILRSIKLYEMHPFFDDKGPNFDLALIMMSTPVKFKANIRPIKMQTRPKDVTATHFIVTSWPNPTGLNETGFKTLELIKRQRVLAVTHLHPTDNEDCVEELKAVNTTNEGIMCLDPMARDVCRRDVGAPVVLNGILWGIISSWKLDDCDSDNTTPIFVSLVSHRNTSIWIRTTIENHLWE